ncbi:MAG: hypothetical protein WC827_03780 [Candidatus Paceibacterota bacterium]
MSMSTLMYCPPYTIDTDSTTVTVYPACNTTTYTCQRCGKSVSEGGKEERVITWKKERKPIALIPHNTDTTAYIKKGLLIIKPDTSYLFHGYSLRLDSAVYEPKLDTIKVVMLVSDTTQISEREYLGLKNGKPTFGYMGLIAKDQFCYWQFGYLITEQHSITSKYLDSNKIPLKPEIIVWLSKSITKN